MNTLPAVTAPPAESAAPPAAAEIVATGKSEKESLLERQNAALKKSVTRALDSKKKVEVANAHLADEVQRLKTVTAPPANPATAKKAWLDSWN